jgi:hypothetical protein
MNAGTGFVGATRSGVVGDSRGGSHIFVYMASMPAMDLRATLIPDFGIIATIVLLFYV